MDLSNLNPGVKKTGDDVVTATPGEGGTVELSDTVSDNGELEVITHQGVEGDISHPISTKPTIMDELEVTATIGEDKYIDLPLVGDADSPSEIKAKLITDPAEIAKQESKYHIRNILIDAVTRQTAQMRLEACENDVTLESVYNVRLETLMKNDKLDKTGFELAKTVLDNSLKVALSMGIPSKDDTDTIFLLAQVATGELNSREQINKIKAMRASKRKCISDDEKSKRRAKAKSAKCARRKQRK